MGAAAVDAAGVESVWLAGRSAPSPRCKAQGTGSAYRCAGRNTARCAQSGVRTFICSQGRTWVVPRTCFNLRPQWLSQPRRPMRNSNRGLPLLVGTECVHNPSHPARLAVPAFASSASQQHPRRGGRCWFLVPYSGVRPHLRARRRWQVIMATTPDKDICFRGCSPGPCPPPPPPDDTDPINSDDWKYWLDGECSPCHGVCASPSKVPTIKNPLAEKWTCAGPNEVLHTFYMDTNCTNEANWADFWKSQGGLTTNMTLPLRLSTNSWVDLGMMGTGSGLQTGHLLQRLGGLHGCSDQVIPLPLCVCVCACVCVIEVEPPQRRCRCRVERSWMSNNVLLVAGGAVQHDRNHSM
eukprot:COSAG02_NODE_7095_length_3188_cov_13.479922_2_plen_352_part_00